MADKRPYTEAKAFYADASYYDGFASKEEKENDETKTPGNLQMKVVRKETAETEFFDMANTRKKFYFVPKHLRQPGQPPLTLLSPEQLELLQENYMVPIRPIPPVEYVAPVPPVALVPPPIPPPQPVVPFTEARIPLVAPMPPPEVSVAPAFPILPIGAEHFQQLMQLVATALQTRQPATAEVFG
ncbi:uncharacterized protein LOC131224310 [Magnolia sinica]|uniref:uncharacterized protein LOC131224310 n=1 Tax=Magnolia sinica TaxID=86752 RepID=UPI00265AE3B4|nr:uncharacterized protein LOC131224310 [Magnolia sinica]